MARALRLLTAALRLSINQSGGRQRHDKWPGHHPTEVVAHKGLEIVEQTYPIGFVHYLGDRVREHQVPVVRGAADILRPQEMDTPEGGYDPLGGTLHAPTLNCSQSPFSRSVRLMGEDARSDPAAGGRLGRGSLAVRRR
jgi:hypothetical protein